MQDLKFFLPCFQNQHKMGDPAMFGLLIGIDPAMLGPQLQWVLYEAAPGTRTHFVQSFNK